MTTCSKCQTRWCNVSSHHCCTKRGHHRAVIRAQPRSRHPQCNADGFTTSRGHLSEPGVGSHTATNHQVINLYSEQASSALVTSTSTTAS